MPSLFSSGNLSGLSVGNRVAMGSMTRGRATNAGLVPTELHVAYYRQRASAGVLFSECLWVSPRGIGFVNVPGLYSEEQVEGWKRVTAAVHQAGGRLFAQLGHSGACSHPDLLGGELPLAPSAINPGLRAFTASGFTETLTPRAMTLADIAATIEEYRVAAVNAKRAGFDGVELHGATTYLLPQFLSSALNVRTDAYGGSPANRARLVVEILGAILDAFGAHRVGIKLSPTLTGVGGFHATNETVATFDELLERLGELPLSHLQIVRARTDLAGTPVAELQDTLPHVRRRYRGTVMANGSFDRASAEAVLDQGLAELVSFATPFIGNPDLVRRLREGLPLASSDRASYYQGGASGYIDYPAAP